MNILQLAYFFATGTYRFFTAIMSKYGIECDFIDLTDISLMEKTIKPNTKVTITYNYTCLVMTPSSARVQGSD